LQWPGSGNASTVTFIGLYLFLIPGGNLPGLFLEARLGGFLYAAYRNEDNELELILTTQSTDHHNWIWEN